MKFSKLLQRTTQDRHKRWFLAFWLILLMFLSFFGFSEFSPFKVPSVKASPDWLSGWDQRVKFTIQASDVDATLTNFPVMLYLSVSSGINNEDVTFVFDEVGSNSLKIAVTTDDEVTQCYVEVESWNNVTEKAYLWVKVPSISSTSNTDLYLYYDNDHADNTAYVGDDPDDTATHSVWDSNFMYVWHLDETGTTMKDSTSNNRDASANGFTAGQRAATGLIAGGVQLDGESGDNNLAITYTHPNEGCLMWWLNVPGYYNYVTNFDNSIDGNDWESWIYSDGRLVCRVELDADVRYDIDNLGGINTWHRVAFCWAKSGTSVTCELFINGVSRAVDTTGTWVNPSGGTHYFGNGNAGNDGGNGYQDECREMNSQRFDAWFKADYETGRDDLLDFGTEETAPSASSVTLNSPTGTETSLTVNFNFTPTFYQSIVNASVYTNETGSWLLEETNSSAVTNATANIISHTLSSTAEGTVLWNVGVWNSTTEVFAESNATFTLDVAPRYQNVDANATSIDEGGTILLYGQGYDGVGLDWAWLSTNETGSWQNYTTANDYVASSFTLEARNPSGGSGSDQVFHQGIAVNETHIWGSRASYLRLYNKDTFAIIDNNTSPHTDGTDMAQVNGMYYNSTNQRIYVGSNNYDTTPKLGYIKVYDASSLSYIEEHQVKNYWCEGCAWHEGYWWVVYGDWDYISKYDDSWSHVADYAIGSYTNTEYQGISWLGDYAYCNNHVGAASATVDILHWTGSGFEGKARLTQIGNPHNCSQGLHFDPDFETNSIIWFAERNNPTGTNYAVNATVNGVDLDIAHYDSPLNCYDTTDTWKWSNFTWTNSSVSDGTAIQWKIYYNDTHGNVNGTGTYTFYVGDGCEYDYVNNNSSNVDSSDPADKGTHSNFENEKACDSTFDTLTEENTGCEGGNWWNSSWLCRKKITFNNIAISENLVNFPMPIVFSSTQLSFWSHVKSDGSDVKFVDADNTTELYFELEYWNSTSDDMVAWTKVPQVNSGSSTDFIWIYYGYSGASFDSYYNSSQVWSTNYEAVWHFNETSGTALLDATGNDNNGTHQGTISVKQDGVLGYAYYMDNSPTGNYVDSDGSISTLNPWMIEVWFDFNAGTNNYGDAWSSQVASGPQYPGQFEYLTDHWEYGIYNQGMSGNCYGTISTGVWTYGVTMGNSSNCYTYLNGTLADSETVDTGNGDIGGATWVIGCRWSEDSEWTDWTVDEMRISSVMRSAEWIEACYQYMKDQTKFTYANEENNVNYELDLEIQWTNANYTRVIEELCIKTGTFSGQTEDIQIKVWNATGSSWHWVMNLTASQWNNCSVSSYLTASTFTVQFLGGTETSDSSQDTWQIDCALLHTWAAPVVYQLNITAVGGSANLTTIDVWTWYNFKANITDADQLSDLVNVTIRVMDNPSVEIDQDTPDFNKTNEYWLRFVDASNDWQIYNGTAWTGTSDYLNVTGCSYPSKSGTNGWYEFRVKLGKTAAKSSLWEFSALVYDSADQTATKAFASITVNFYTELTVITTTHTWTIIQGQNDILIDQGTISFTVTANAEFKIQAKGSGDLSSNGNTLGLGNVTIHKDVLGSSISLTTSYVDVGGLTSQAAGEDLGLTVKLWCDIPAGQPVGDYVYTLYLSVGQQT